MEENTTMSDFVAVAKVSDFADTEKQLIELDDRLLVLVHAGGEFYCLDDICTHDGGTLYDGELVDGCIRCPRHGACFDVKTGAAITMPATEPTAVHETKSDGDTVYVRLVAST